MKQGPENLRPVTRLAGHENVGESSVGRLEFQIHDFIGHVFSKHWEVLATDAGFSAVKAQKILLTEEGEHHVRETLAGLVNSDTAPDESEGQIPRLVALAELYLEQNVDPVAREIIGGTSEPTDGRYATATTPYLMQKLNSYEPNVADSAQPLRGIAHEYMKRRRQPSTMFADLGRRAA